MPSLPLKRLAASQVPENEQGKRRALSLRSLQPGEKVYLLKSLETGKSAVMVTRPYRLTSRERWSWVLRRPVKTSSRRKRKEPQL
jgi:hypothetical protein